MNARMTEKQKMALGAIIVNAVLLIRAIWFECGEDNKELFIERSATFVGEVEESMQEV